MYSIDATLRRNYLGTVLQTSTDPNTYYVTDMSDVVVPTSPSAVNTIMSWASEYILPNNVQNLVVQYAADAIGVGNAQDNILIADGGNNYTLVGGKGNDVLIGNGSGAEFDSGTGSTTFVVSAGDGNDVISNFRPGIDTVRLYDFTNLAGFATVKSEMAQVGSDVVLTLGTNQTITFRNETVASLTANDFELPAYLTNMTLRFDDEFNSFTWSPDGSKGWMTQGGNVWRTLSGNNEQEYYSDSTVGVNPFSLSGGVLDINATPGSNPLGLPYNSGIITTEKSFNFEYGLVEVNAKLPAGQGLWPAIWLLPSDLGWPPEIDIMEMLGDNPTMIYASTHSGSSNISSTQPVYVGDTSTAFHTYGVDWEPTTITWYFDGTAIATAATPSDMNQPMYLLINLAVGGGWPGNPDSTTVFPATMSIDWVRIYASPNTVAVSGTQALSASGTPSTIMGTAATTGTKPPPADTTGPTVTSIATSAGSSLLTAGSVVTFTVNFSEAVTVVVTGGKPTLLLNDGGVANYVSGSGTTALVFSHTVAAGQNTTDLALASSAALALNGATIRDAAGNNATIAGANGYNPAGTLTVDTSGPSFASATTSPGSGSVTTGSVVTFTVTFNQAVTVSGGKPALLLNDGGTASYVSGSGTTALTFSYTVSAGQSASDLALASTGALALNGATIRDAAGNNAALTGANGYNPAGTLAVNTAAASIASITTSPGSGLVTAGSVVTFTMSFSQAVTVAGGKPTLLLNDGGIATYASGSGTAALVFTYTVAAGQGAADLALASTGAVTLNGATIRDASGSNALLTAANGYNPAGTLAVNTTSPSIASIATSPGSGSLVADSVVTFTVSFNQAVTVAGGKPTLLLNDGGTATYASGSGTAALVFTYTVAAGRNTSDLTLASTGALALNGATVRDSAGNNAVLTGANGYDPTGTLAVDTTAPSITSIATSPGSGTVGTGSTVTLTVSFGETVNLAGGKPSLLLNDGGTATYVSGSGTSALTFTYTVAAGQTATDLALASTGAFLLNGTRIRDAAGNSAVLTAANGYNPAGILAVGTSPTVKSIVVSGVSETYSPGAGTYNVSGNASWATIALGDGNQTVNVTGDYNEIKTGNGNNDITATGAASVITTGSGANTIAASGHFSTITVGATPTGTTSITASGWGDQITSTGAGNVSVAGSTGGTTITLGNGNHSINLSGGYNSVTTGAGTSTITMGTTGQSEAHTGAGGSTIFAGAWNNVLDAGAGVNFLHGGAGNDTFVLNGAGQGMDNIYGFSLTNGDKLDLIRTLSSVSSAVDVTNVRNYITSSVSNGDTVLYVDPTGGNGSAAAFATLVGTTATVANLVARNQLIVP